MLEGFVEAWSDSEAVLKSLDGQSLLIIHRPNEDIMMTKVILIESNHTEIEGPKDSEKIRQKLHQVLTQPEENEDLQDKSISELRQMVIEQEKQLIAQKRKEHFGSYQSKGLTRYGTPRSAYMPGKIPPGIR